MLVDSLMSGTVAASLELAIAAVEATGQHRASIHLCGPNGAERVDTIVQGCVGESIDLHQPVLERVVHVVASAGVRRFVPLRALGLPDEIEHRGLRLRAAEIYPLRFLDAGAGALVVWTEQRSELGPQGRAYLERIAGLVGVGLGQEIERTSRRSVREVGALRIDLVERTVRVDGRIVRLTPIESTILGLLSEQPGRPVSREQIVLQLFGSTHVGESRAADVHIKNLRLKLRDSSSLQRWIVTMRGVGYALRAS